MTVEEWLAKMRSASGRASLVEREAIRAGANSVAFTRRSPLETRVQAAGNRMRVSGRVDTPRVVSAIVTGGESSIEEHWR